MMLWIELNWLTGRHVLFCVVECGVS